MGADLPIAATAPSDDRAAQPVEAVANFSDLIDLEALADRIDALARVNPKREALIREVKAELRDLLESARETVRQRFLSRRRVGRETIAALSWITDQVLITLHDVIVNHAHPLSNPTKTERLTLIAVGGYGRGEMAPFSDVDILFLTPYKQTPWGETVIEAMLYVLWDLKLKVGQSVRSVDDCVRLAASDITIRTALLEKRFLAGDRALFDELDARLWNDLFLKTGPAFVEAKLTERNQRHDRQGGSRYLVEPNVKESKGGLRDLQTLYWIGKYLFRVDKPDDFVERDLFTELEAYRFKAAEEFLWTVRCHLHYIANRAQDQLAFDMQIEIADAMGYRTTSGMRAVERFMQRYFLYAKAAGDLTRFFCTVLEQRHAKASPSIGARLRSLITWGADTAGPGMIIRDGRLTIENAAWLSDDPVNIFRVFATGLKSGALIHHEAFRLIARNLHLIDDAVRADPVANRLFMNMLLSHKLAVRGLRRMNETGVLGRFIPEFGRIVSMMQFSMYHHFTVDEHTINCIDVLSRIIDGELVEDLPVASEIIQTGVDRRVLTVALFLHDIGKGLPEAHSEVGARIAEELCPRLGLDMAETEAVVWLVRHHLLMSDVAQKRDISDPMTVRSFADQVKSIERLKLLLVLTVCDIRGVGPGVWNNWKAQLLRQLYRDTLELVTGGHAILSADQRVARAREALMKRLSGVPKKQLNKLADSFYAPYWIGFSLDTQEIHFRLAIEAKGNGVASRFLPDEGRDATMAVLYLQDHPGIFSRMAGAFSLAGASIIDARTFTTADGMAASAFWLQNKSGRPYAAREIPRLQRYVEDVLAGRVKPRDVLMKKRQLKRREQPFTHPTRIVFDNESSSIYTVIEVNARDRVGLLYELTRALAGANINISSAIVATYGEHVVDSFYVKDLFGLKITGRAKQQAIEKRLREAIEIGSMEIEAI